MPELPEVETIVRGLAGYLEGAEITRVEIRLPRIAQPSAELLSSALPGRTVISCVRRAKYVVMNLDDCSRLLVHLRMTGRLIYEARQKTEAGKINGAGQKNSAGQENNAINFAPKHAHITLHFRDRACLHFADVRTFGRMQLVAPGEDWDRELGPEPLEAAFTTQRFAQDLKGRRTTIKTLLLDQRKVAGIGNIYACEALWQSGIAPQLPADDLRPTQIKALHEAIRDVLVRAIDMRGTSARDYVDVEGLKGGFQNVLSVYGRHGLPCPRCATPISRIVLAQRGTWFCPRCQKMPSARRSPSR